MTEQKNEIQTKLAIQDAKINVFMPKMRNLDNQWAEDIREIRKILKNLQLSNQIVEIAAIIGMTIIFIKVLLK